jgi:hypothetical protein
MSTNYDEVKIELSKPEKTNVLSATEHMAYADTTDCVDKVELLSVRSENHELRRTPRLDKPREIVYTITSYHKYGGRLTFNTELGTVELSTDANRFDLTGVVAVFRITRINHNRRRRQ